MCSMMKRTIEIREEGVPEAFTVVRKSWEEGGGISAGADSYHGSGQRHSLPLDAKAPLDQGPQFGLVRESV